MVKVLLQQHPWIEKEKGFFGLAGSDFDFKSKVPRLSLSHSLTP